jgi:hypothetical protein
MLMGIGCTRRTSGWRLSVICFLSSLSVFASDPADFEILNQSIEQVDGNWNVNFTLQNRGAVGRALDVAEIAASVEGDVSNSALPGHSHPIASFLEATSEAGPVWKDIIPSSSDDDRCREGLKLEAWLADSRRAPEGNKLLLVAPGGKVSVRLTLIHDHPFYGTYDPLLGTRLIRLRIGTQELRRKFEFQQQYTALPSYTWPEPPEERRDKEIYFSAPDSIYFSGLFGELHSYWLPERPVRYGSKVKLSFLYVIAVGSAGTSSVQISQWQDLPKSVKRLPEVALSIPLDRIGRWTKFEKTFTIDRRATHAQVGLKISSGEVGDMWVDDIKWETLSPVNRRENP